MRNLKRALSLTLASVMLLGMMVIGSSAAVGFPDVDENDNVEAIEVLQAVEVMVGDDRGFGPDRPVTRNEMAVVMGKLLNLNYNYYASSCPFTDVAEWARGWVGACYANGIVSGRGEGIYDGEATVTAVEAASMMMRALGYFKYTEDYADGFQLVTVRQGSEIGIFNDVGTDAATPMTRNQVAQMALNALKANMVTFTGTPGIEVNGVKVGYKAEYTPRTSPERKYAAIGKLVSNIGITDQYYIQLGEELYDGDLRLNDSTYDDFGRPSRYWEYDGTAIGTYAKKELIHETYTTKVTGKTLYDLLGKDLVNLIDGSNRDTSYTLTVTIDGNDDNATQTKVFGKSALTRTNTDGVGGTGNGVLTEVYVDNTARSIDIAIINTYLAIADNDYNEKRDEVSLNVYNLDKSGSLYFKDYKHDGEGDNWRDAETVLKVNGEDFNIVDVKADDKFLVTVANGEIKSVVAPEILTEQTITSHKTNDYVVSDKQYDYATTAQYDVDVMESFGSDDMKEVTYNVVLDKYGYLIGVEKNEAVNQYVFLTGVDDEFSHLSQKNVPANVIFLDGTMETITINAKKSVLRYDAEGLEANTDDVYIADAGAGHPRKPSQANMWCTYSVDSDGIYTLKAVAGVTNDGTDGNPKVKVAQASQNASSDIKINSKNISLDGSAPFTKVHGNADTVYINTTPLENVDVTVADKRMIIDDVDSVTTGVTNVDMTVKNITDSGSYGAPADEIYTLYNDKGVIIAVVTLDAEDNATTARYAYINSNSIDHRDYDDSAKEYSWYRQAIVDGEFVMLKEVDDSSSSTYLAAMTRGKWYEIKYNADDEVRGYLTVTYATDDGSAPSGKSAPTGTKTSTETNVGTNYMEDANFVARALDKTFILNANLTATKPELKTLGNTLYIGNSTTEGFYVSPTAKVVVYTKNYDKHEEYTGAEMEKALNALVNKKAFEGYVNAVIGANGIATVVILDEKNMDAPDTYSVTFDSLDNVTSPAANITGIAKGDSATFTVTAKNGYVLDSVKVGATTLNPDANGVYTITNITEDVTVTIATTKDPGAYDGEMEVSLDDYNRDGTTGKEWAMSVTYDGDKPELTQIIKAIVEKVATEKNVKFVESASDEHGNIKLTFTDKDGYMKYYAIYNTGVGATKQTTLTGNVNTSSLTAALSANSKVILASGATADLGTSGLAQGKEIEVQSGAKLTMGAGAVAGLVSGAGDVEVSGAVTGGELVQNTGSLTIKTGGSIDQAGAVEGQAVIYDGGSIASGGTTITGEAVIKSGSTFTLSASDMFTANQITVESGVTFKGVKDNKITVQTMVLKDGATYVLNSDQSDASKVTLPVCYDLEISLNNHTLKGSIGTFTYSPTTNTLDEAIMKANQVLKKDTDFFGFFDATIPSDAVTNPDL